MKKTMNRRKYVIWTGVSLVVMTIVAGIAMGAIYAPVFNMDKATFTEQFPELKNALLFGTFGWIIILACDLIVSWGLYQFYKSKNARKAMIMGLLRLFYSLILLVGIIQLVRASVFSIEAEETYVLVHDFQSIWHFGLIVFGVHLLYLAPLVCEKHTIKMVISGALFFAGIGYVLSNTMDFFIDDYELIRPKVEAVFILPMIFGELALAIWLLVKGGKEPSLKEKQYVFESY